MTTKPQRVTEGQLDAVCRPGAGEATCSFLMRGPDGWACGKGTDMESLIIAKRATMRAQGDNCSGPPEWRQR